MGNFLTQFEVTIAALQSNMPLILSLIGAMFVIHFFNWLGGYRLNYLGIYPRRWWSLGGIFVAPFLHGDFNHLFYNSIPLFMLLSFASVNGLPMFVCVLAIIIVIAGLGTWLIGRPGFHIGASGLNMGLWSYLVLNAYLHQTPIALGLAVVMLYYLIGMFFDLFPTSSRTSWEAHSAGFLGGIVAVYLSPYLVTQYLLHYS